MSQGNILSKAFSLVSIAAISSIGFGTLTNTIVDKIDEPGDGAAYKATYNLIERIEKEKSRSEDVGADTPITELSAISELSDGWEERILVRTGQFRQYFISEGSTADDYCLMVKQSYGEDARDGYIYSVKDDVVDKRADSSCKDENFVQIAGPEEDIPLNEDSGAWGNPLPFAAAPGIIGFIALTKRLYREPEEEQKAIDAVETSLVDPSTMSKAEISKFRSALRERVNSVIQQWSEYETDAVKIIDYPMVTNMGFAPTSEFHLALIRAKSLIPNDSYDILLFERAVIELEHAYKVMISEAKRMKWSEFSVDEQRSLQKAKQLLKMASNSSSSPNERNVAYKRLLKEVEGILSLSPVTMMAIEAGAKLHISDRSS